MDTGKLDDLGAIHDGTDSVGKGYENGAEPPPPVIPIAGDVTDTQIKPQTRRRRKSRGEGGKPPQVANAPTTSRSLHLSRLNPIEMEVMLAISQLNACQIPGRNLDPDRVRLYREMLDLQFPPNIIVIRDRNGKYHIASGHHRVAGLLAAGYPEAKCDVYEGTVVDAIIIGGEENQGPAPMSLAAKKSLLDTLLSLEDSQKYSISEMAAMTGLDRHTVASLMEKRNTGGDFIALASRMKQDKSPEEQLYDAAKGVARNIKKHGVDVMVKALELMQPYLRKELLAKIALRDGE